MKKNPFFIVTQSTWVSDFVPWNTFEILGSSLQKLFEDYFESFILHVGREIVNNESHKREDMQFKKLFMIQVKKAITGYFSDKQKNLHCCKEFSVSPTFFRYYQNSDK